MTTPNVQLGSLNFESIKDSIVEYLKTQDTLKDYDYAGSAMQVLLDVLAYNTLYYGYYTNMVANEMFLDSAQKLESIISLVKPLGYVIPGKYSSRAKVKVRHASPEGTLIPKYTRFFGKNTNGVSYSFYTIEEYSLNADGEQIVNIVEGKSLIKEFPILVDVETQKYFLTGLDTDISTIRIEVQNKETAEWEEWAKSDNIHSGLNETSKVYWLERSELGFFVVFGGNLGASTTVQIGKQITENDNVRITYIKSSGEDGNGVGNFRIDYFNNAANETISLSSGGANDPNLDTIKFFAPKWFAAQDRAVTVEDCRALLARTLISDVSNPFERFNVWGGEEMDPPMYGRVFVSVNEENSEDLALLAGDAIALLKEKTCVTILPEFINPDFVEVVVGGTVHWDPMNTELSRDSVMGNLLKDLSDSFITGFENVYNTSFISNVANNSNPSISSVSDDYNINIQRKIFPKFESGNTIRFYNKLKTSSLYTTEFSYGTKYNEIENSDQKIRLRVVESPDSKGNQKVEGYYTTDTGLLVRLLGAGTFNPSMGEFKLERGVAADNEEGEFILTIEPYDKLYKAIFSTVSRPRFELTLERII